MRPLSMSINLTNMTPVNRYKFDKSGPSKWVIVVDKMALVIGLEKLTFYLKERCFENQECKYFGTALVNKLEYLTFYLKQIF